MPSRSVKVSFDKAWLADETDVEHYLESMREALLVEIRKVNEFKLDIRIYFVTSTKMVRPWTVVPSDTLMISFGKLRTDNGNHKTKEVPQFARRNLLEQVSAKLKLVLAETAPPAGKC